MLSSAASSAPALRGTGSAVAAARGPAAAAWDAATLRGRLRACGRSRGAFSGIAGCTPSTASQCGSTPTSSGARGGFLPTICGKVAPQCCEDVRLSVAQCAAMHTPLHPSSDRSYAPAQAHHSAVCATLSAQQPWLCISCRCSRASHTCWNGTSRSSKNQRSACPAACRKRAASLLPLAKP